MNQGHVLHRRTVCCPACRSDRYTIYRRFPGGEGRIVNRCFCIRCDGSFEYHEDRYGRLVEAAPAASK